MRRRRSFLPLALFLLLAGAATTAASAQDQYPFRVSAFYGLGGDFDGGNFDNGSYQLGFSWATDTDTYVSLRYGEIGFDEGPDERLGSDLRYATIGGEFMFNEGYYKSGLYIGLGWYSLDEDELPAPSEDAAGIAVGVTGDFKLTQRFSLLVELSGHYTDLDDAELLGMGHVGVAFHF